jgi:7-cyano-7-deazaguanine synthase
MRKKIVLSLSGGMDSTVLLYMAAQRLNPVDIYTLSFDYGQRHSRELNCINYHLMEVNNRNAFPDNSCPPLVTVTNKVIDVRYIKDIAPVSSLTNTSIDNPKIKEMAGDAQPISYVPFRNMMFLSIASSYAESVGADEVWYGAAQADSLAGYWDGSNEFLNSINNTLSLNRKTKIKIVAPLLEMSKKDIVLEGIKLDVAFSQTWTCYSNRDDGLADADTPSSSLRLRGFIEAGYIDPVKYTQQDKLDKIYKDKNCKLVP